MMTIYLLHSSHTDIGYTDIQEKMKAHHIAFIREVLSLCEKDEDFVWNCESYWCVRKFLQEADDSERAAFIRAVKNGNIGLSGSYLNLTELIPEDVYEQTMDACEAEWASLGVRVQSAMTADINGYSWGMTEILLNHGVTRLMSNIHTHHGYHPLFQKQTPFWWEAPNGRRLLSWNGEHYNLGNELGMAQTPGFEYTVQDGLSLAPLPLDEKADLRIAAYVRSLREQGYALDILPIAVSGSMTDNAPPSLAVLDFTRRFNARHTDIQIKLATLDSFFDALERCGADFPTYRGDWTDWWADGIGSTPADVAMYRQAARAFSVCQKLGARRNTALQVPYEDALNNLMFYAEHTWGYSSSITEPFHPQVNNLAQWKRLYALKACESAAILRERTQRQLGETAVSLHRELKFRAVNPHDVPVEDMLKIDLEHFYGHERFLVRDEKTGESVPFQLSRHSRGPEMCIWLRLGAGETNTYILASAPDVPLPSAGRKAKTGIEGVDDLNWRMLEERARDDSTTEYYAVNRFFHIRYEPGAGVVSLLDRVRGTELVRPDAPYAAFTPIYERTEPRQGEDELYVRRNMGRNRKALRTKREAGMLKDVRVLEKGTLYDRVELSYDLPSVKHCSVLLTLYKLAPRIGVDLRLQKDCVWEPENLYLSLPFAKAETWVDKTGCCLRPGIDQLPGTCLDFYCVQNGAAFMDKDGGVILSSPDVPLMSFGSLPAHPISLMGEEKAQRTEVYSWVMNNFWETNFNASLAGFYQFHYDLMLTDSRSGADALKKARVLNEGVLQFYLFEGEKVDG